MYEMKELFEKIGGFGLVPVIKIDDIEKAVPLAKALCDGPQSLTPDQFDELAKLVFELRPHACRYND